MGHRPDTGNDLRPEGRPPRIFERLLQRFLPHSVRDAIAGDLLEDYAAHRARHGRHAAGRRYAREALAALLYSMLLSDAVRRDEWKGISMDRRRSLTMTLLANAGAFAAFWVLLFLTLRMTETFSGRPLVPLFATGAGVLFAIRLRARFMALFLSAMAAFQLAEVIAQTIWWQGVLRGAQTHFAVMGAAVFGVVLGLIVNRTMTNTTEAHPQAR
ncbi:MAG TPA: permease prefix domain 2-containing transporter [Thermoanaerobaculia bacterium]